MALTLFEDIKTYNLKLLSKDALAGLTVATILIPQSMAYALLAGFEPIYGLYASLVPLILYAVFASSRYLSVGPVALMSIIILGGISSFAKPMSELYIQLTMLSALLAGLIQVAMSLLRAGNFASYLTKPSMSGFISAAAVIITISQFKYLLSLELPRRVSCINMIWDVFDGIGDTNFISVGLGLGSIFLIYFSKSIHKSIPIALILVFTTSLLVQVFSLRNLGVPIVGNMPTGLPTLGLDFLAWNNVIMILPTAFIIALVCFIGSYSIATSISYRSKEKHISANRELMALGLAKVFGSFFLAMPSTGSFSRSAINYDAGAKTQISSIIAALIVLVTLMYLGHLFYYLPLPVLAAIIITSVLGLIDIEYAKELYATSKSQLFDFLVTFLATLYFGIINGIIIGIVISQVLRLYRNFR